MSKFLAEIANLSYSTLAIIMLTGACVLTIAEWIAQ